MIHCFEVLHDGAAPWLCVWRIYTKYVMAILEIFFTDFTDFRGIPDIAMGKCYDGSGAIVRGEAKDIEPEVALCVPDPHMGMRVCFVVVTGWRY